MTTQTPVSKELGERLRERRKQLGLTLVELGQRIGLSHSYVAQVERAQRNLSGPSARVLFEALGLSAEWLFADGEHLPPLADMLAAGNPFPDGLVPPVTPKQRIRAAIRELEAAVAELEK